MRFWYQRTRFLWGAVGVAFAVGLFAGYPVVRRLPGDTAPSLVVQLLVVAGLVAGSALLASWYMRWYFHRSIRNLSERVADLQQAPAPDALRSLPAEFRPLARQLEALCACYREERTDRDAQQDTLKTLRKEQHQAEATLQSMLGRVDAEEGQSHSLIHRRVVAGDDVSREMIARLAPNLHWMAATPPLQHFLGANVTDLNAHSFVDVVHADDVAELARAFEKVLVTGEGHNIVFRVVTRAGKECHVQMDALTRYSDDGTPLHLRCHLLDITEKVRTENELRRKTEQLSQANGRLQWINRDLERLKESYRDLYHHSPVMYFSLDAQGRFAACNETMLRALGYQPEELTDQLYVRLLTRASRERFLQDPAAYQKPGEVETQWATKGGKVIDVWIRTVPVHDSSGRFLRSRSAAQDVTERIRLADALRAQAEELQRANEQLRRINRELDDFTYVVSHDLKEPLRTLQVFGNFLTADYGEQLGPEGQEFIKHMTQASRRLGRLIDDLLTLSRAGRVLNTPLEFNLADSVATVCDDLGSLIQRKNAVVRIEGAMPMVLGDPQRITQLLTNLVSNGLKYNSSPQPEVVVGSATPAPVRHSEKSTMVQRSGDYVTIFVRDNGIGIDPRYHEQIFGIFRRLHLPEEYEGTGAGLAICKKIIESHGSRIWVESGPGAGATFYFTMVRAQLGSHRTTASAPATVKMLLPTIP